MQIGRAQIQIMTMSASVGALVIVITEQDCATQVHEQSNTGDADCLVKMN